MFAQANSEHCRHKIFNAQFIIDGVERRTLAVRDDPQHATQRAPTRRAVGVSGQCGSHRGQPAARAGFPIRAAASIAVSDEPIDILMKVETHNHPTAISPFPGAATGSGGEIRDEGADRPRCQTKGRTGRLLGFAPAHSRFRCSPGSAASAGPARIASALEIMLEGPIGAAAFNNEFGRPGICGFFRTLETAHCLAMTRAAPAAITSPSCWPAGSAMCAGACGEERGFGRRRAGGARRACHADRARWWRGLVVRQRQFERRAGFRLGPTRQSRDAAAGAGSHRPLLGARRSSIPSSSFTTWAPEDCPMRCPRRSPTATAARASICARCPVPSLACRRSSSGATKRRSVSC